MFTHVRDYIIVYCFQSTLINSDAPVALRSCVRSACDDRGCDDAKYLALDLKRWQLSHNPKVLQHTDPLGDAFLGVL